MKQNIPIYLITGFLESGKTRFIQEMLEDKEFNTGEKTLLLVCEEGIEEYEPEKFFGQNVWMHLVEKEEDLTPDNMIREVKKRPYERIIVEYNGMWPLQRLYESMPDNCFINDQVMLADASTFENYNTNMRQQAVWMMTDAAYIIFNRCTDSTDTDRLHKIVRGSNRRCGMNYEYTDGHSVNDTTEDPLPFDINAPVVEIADRDYAIWYADLTEKTASYDGKTVKFKGVCATDKKLPAGNFVIGRHVMNCCAADITYMGLAAVQGVLLQEVHDYDWFEITAKIVIEKHVIYRGKGPVLRVQKLERCAPPDVKVATFY